MLSLGEQLVTLTNVPEDSPEVDHLAREYIRHFETYPPSEMMPKGSVWASDDTHGGVFADILTSNMSPAQRRVLDLANEHFTEEEKP